MDYPASMQAFPGLDVPFDPDVVTCHAVASPDALVVFFSIHRDTEIAEHHHGPQWGALFEGEIVLTVAGDTRTCRPGDTWDIGDGVPHSAKLKAGSRLLDVFAEPDRYRIRRN